MRKSFDLDGRVVAVTGGARGIGLATARELAAAGARVAIGDLNEEESTAAAASIDGTAMGAALDVTDPVSVTAFLDRTEAELGPLYAFVNNAGVMLTGEFLTETSRSTEQMMAVNLRGVLNGARLAGERFSRQGSGHLVNIASMAGVAGMPGIATYCATKFAVVGLSEALREEWRPAGIRVSLVLPGVVRTELSAGLTLPSGVARLATVDPEDVAAAVVEVLRRDRPVTYVPARLGAVLRLGAMLPERLRRRVNDAMGADRAFLQTEPGARDAYNQRATGGGS